MTKITEAWGGSYYIGNTSTRTLNGKGQQLTVESIIVHADTVFDTLTGVDPVGNVVDFLTILGLDVDSPSPTIKEGTLIRVEKDWYITTIKLASGSIWTYM